ncbi:AbrB/MazE/SpoVT family DNA-binding domain-containing protein [Sphaerobacter thermophilus]|mgnify:FL=1|uniref:AbrB/MazE/SpoVT family DNA-binding domain-containing protein n=1 Tax=Sphaerobacter thermophilus TaxID=2057 RepID=UPI000DB5C312|nr:MAG: AbrB family transcriptional regulator [Sphaerobacter thermophilus]
MTEIIATVSSKGQITIPAAVRRHLGVAPGGKVVFAISDEGIVTMRRAAYPSIASLRGAAGTLRGPLAWSHVRRIAREDALSESHPDAR